MRIWAKILEDDKIIKDIIIEYDNNHSFHYYEKCLIDICHKLDIPTPLTLKYHYNCYNEFNTVKYIPQDFVETVSFTSFILENCIEK